MDAPEATEPEAEPEPQLTPVEWKAKGNEHYKIKEYIKAIECYTKAVDGAPDEPMFLNNRASARVMMLDYKGALEDSTKAMTLLPNTVKYMEKVNIIDLSSLKSVLKCTELRMLRPSSRSTARHAADTLVPTLQSDDGVLTCTLLMPTLL